MIRQIRAGVRFGAISAVSLAMLLIWFVQRPLLLRTEAARLRAAARWTRRWARSMAWICGFRVRVSGPLPPPGALLTPNHTGYVDVLALGAVLRCFFAPKAEAATWPLIGPLIRASGQVEIVRRRGRSVLDAAEAIRRRLALGESVCLFLEGTSSGGGVLPFKPSLLAAAVEQGAPIVPVAIRYAVDDPAADVAEVVAYWKPEHELAGHLWRLLGLPRVYVGITFGQAERPGAEGNRRELAEKLEHEVRELFDGTRAVGRGNGTE